MGIKFINAHRGYSTLYPENTMPAFIAAFEAGCTGIEIDVLSTIDGVPVCMHDISVDRTTDGIGNVNELTYAYLSGLDAGSWKGDQFIGEQIPKIEEVLDYFKGKNVFLVFDMKNNTNQNGHILGKMVAERNMSYQCQFRSFNKSALAAARQHCPRSELTLATTTEETDIPLISASGFNSVSSTISRSTAELVTAAHSTNIDYYCCLESGSKTEMDTALAYNVDSMTGNDCETMMQFAVDNSFSLEYPSRSFYAAIPKVWNGTGWKKVKQMVYTGAQFKEIQAKY